MAHWANQPELREELAKALDELVDGMKKAGQSDWRMWNELITKIGLDDVKNVDLTSGGEPVASAYKELTVDELRKLAAK